VSEAFEDADDSADGDGGQEGLVLDDLGDLVFGLLCFGLVVDLAFLDVLGGGFGGLGVGLGGGGGIEGVAVEEVLDASAGQLWDGVGGTYVGKRAEELDGGKHIGAVEQKRERCDDGC
jgi:hypothetical protein